MNLFKILCVSYPGGNCNVVRKCTVSEIQNLTLWCVKLQGNNFKTNLGHDCSRIQK